MYLRSPRRNAARSCTSSSRLQALCAQLGPAAAPGGPPPLRERPNEKHSARLADATQSRKMKLMGEIERRAADAVEPLMRKWGLTPRSDEELAAGAVAAAAALPSADLPSVSSRQNATAFQVAAAIDAYEARLRAPAQVSTLRQPVPKSCVHAA